MKEKLKTITLVICQTVLLLPSASVQGLSHGNVNRTHAHDEIIPRQNVHELSAKLKSDIAIHGLLLWASMGLLMPAGILVIRMSMREKNITRIRAFFFVHIILQVLSLLVATAGAILSIKSFDNTFSNYHQRLGLVLYIAIWVQALIGLFRPQRGTKRRSTWYFVHWILGTTVSLLGIINIYTGMMAYHAKTSKTTWVWNILFTAQVSLIAFLYLLIDKWEYLQREGVILGNDQLPVVTASNQVTPQREQHGKTMVPEPCGKRNALKNLFD